MARAQKEFKVETVSEGGLGTLLFGSSSLPTEALEEVMNTYGAMGYDVAFIVIEKKRFLLFWQRETAIITFSRTK